MEGEETQIYLPGSQDVHCHLKAAGRARRLDREVHTAVGDGRDVELGADSLGHTRGIRVGLFVLFPCRLVPRASVSLYLCVKTYGEEGVGRVMCLGEFQSIRVDVHRDDTTCAKSFGNGH